VGYNVGVKVEEFVGSISTIVGSAVKVGIVVGRGGIVGVFVAFTLGVKATVKIGVEFWLLQATMLIKIKPIRNH
jgi:hypothetical protein